MSPPKMKFVRAGTQLEIPSNPDSLPTEIKREILFDRYTGWYGRIYHLNGRPIFSV